MGISKQDMIAQIESEYEEEKDPHFFFDEHDASEDDDFDEEEYEIQLAMDRYEEDQIESMIEDDERAAQFVASIVDAYKQFAKAFPELDAKERKESGDISFEQALTHVEESAIIMSRYI